MEQLLWERHFERHAPDPVWLERIAFLLSRIGITIEGFMAAYAGVKEPLDVEPWQPWATPSPADPAGAGADGPGLVSEAEVQAAWGDAYEAVSASAVPDADRDADGDGDG